MNGGRAMIIFTLANDGSHGVYHERQSGFQDNSSSLELVNKPALLDKFT